ncbi:MAG: hypothetical protein KFW09_03385 [Oscillospiraceae bacterium]|nr:hypothetical protein [Oscillospiraceae bacterium]
MTYFYLHMILIVVAMIFFLFEYKKEKKIYQLILLIWIPFSGLRYISDNRIFLIGVGIFQFILFGLMLFFLFKEKKSALDKSSENKQADLSEIEKEEKEKEVIVDDSTNIK